MNTLRVAVIQAEVGGNLADGLVQTDALTRNAAAGGATLVAFPETWLPGFPIWLDVCRDVAIWDSPAVKTVFARHAAGAVDVSGVEGRELARIAAAHRVTLAIGVVERVSGGPGYHTLYNALLVYGPDGTLLNHHRKLLPTYSERMVWGPGDADGLRAIAEPHSGARVGGLICWEHWMPLARQAMHDSGEDIHLALWPTAHEMHQIACRQYAFEGRCYVLSAGSLMRARALPPELEPHPERVKSADQFVLRGGSAIIRPDGSYLVEPVFESPALLVADLDLAACRKEAMTLDVAGHYARPDTFGFSVRRGTRATRANSESQGGEKGDVRIQK